MKDKIIEILSSFIEEYIEIKKDDCPEIAAEIEAALIWHGPDEVPPRYSLFSESILVVNQSGENVFFDFIDQTWVNYQIPSRSAHVEKWRYPAPIKKQDGDNLLKDGDDYRNQKAKKVFENCFISVTHGQPNILLNNHDLKELYDAMDSVFFEDVEWSWEFGENHLENGVYKCAITITDQDEWGIYFYIDQISLVSSF